MGEISMFAHPGQKAGYAPVPNSAIKLVAYVKRDQNIDAARRALHWLPIKDRIVFKLLLITYKIRNGLAPDYLNDLVTEYTPTRTLRSSSKCLLQPPSSREILTASYGDRAFSVAAPSLWNQIPLSIRNADSVNCFKRLLKTHLFNHPIN